MKPRYVPRRLQQKRRTPNYVISSTGPITLETAQRVKALWRTAVRTGDPLIVDGTRFSIRPLP